MSVRPPNVPPPANMAANSRQYFNLKPGMALPQQQPQSQPPPAQQPPQRSQMMALPASSQQLSQSMGGLGQSTSQSGPQSLSQSMPNMATPSGAASQPPVSISTSSKPAAVKPPATKPSSLVVSTAPISIPQSTITTTGSAGPAGSSFRAQQAKQRQELLKHAQLFLNTPKPPSAPPVQSAPIALPIPGVTPGSQINTNPDIPTKLEIPNQNPEKESSKSDK